MLWASESFTSRAAATRMPSTCSSKVPERVACAAETSACCDFSTAWSAARLSRSAFTSFTLSCMALIAFCTAAGLVLVGKMSAEVAAIKCSRSCWRWASARSECRRQE